MNIELKYGEINSHEEWVVWFREKPHIRDVTFPVRISIEPIIDTVVILLNPFYKLRNENETTQNDS